MELENGNRGMRICYLLRAIGDVLRDQMGAAERPFGGGDHIGDVVLPRHSDAAEVGFVANLIIDIVEAVEFGDDLADERLVDG